MPTVTHVDELKINELTEAQYDAAVQGGTIGANEISVLTDASTTTSLTVTLTSAGWVNGSQTAVAAGVTANNIVFVSPAPASASDYASAGILCTSQSADSLTFSCTQTPSVAIVINVVCM